MAELETRDRKGIRKSDFAYVDAEGEGYLPIQDESHVQNAIARYNQTEFESKAAKGRTRKKITAAKMHKIGVDEDEQIARPVTSLRAASTKAGPRGGRKENWSRWQPRSSARRPVRRSRRLSRRRGRSTISHMPKATRTALGKQGAKVAKEKRDSQG